MGYLTSSATGPLAHPSPMPGHLVALGQRAVPAMRIISLQHSHQRTNLPTYSYLGLLGSDPVKRPGVAKKNVLLFLEMTDGQPSPEERYLEFSGNRATSQIPAIMCIGSPLFFDSHLMRCHAILDPTMAVADVIFMFANLNKRGIEHPI